MKSYQHITTAIILLNWNGADDTIECLASLYQMHTSFYVVVVDNGSQDDSLARISHYINSSGIASRLLHAGEKLASAPCLRECIIYETGENLGFARGNNAGVRLLYDYAPDRYLLLNNDTIVEPDFLDRLLSFHVSNPEYVALTPLICYNEPRTLVWNAGGRQIFGVRRYFYAKSPVAAITEKGHIPVTFLTGCALFFGEEALQADGVPLTERFFFGEEDFDFCMRMNEAGKKMACVLDSKIYHKVSASLQKNGKHIGKIYINTLNRFIDLRLHYTLWRYLLWALCYIPHLHILIFRGGYGLRASLVIPWRAFYSSFQKDGVSYADFISALRG